MRCSRRETRAQTVPDDGRSSRQISPAPTMGGDGDGERQDGDRKVELDEDTKKMLEDFIGAPIDDMTHPFWHPPPLTEEEEAIFEDVKRRAKECIGLDGFTEDLLLKDMHVQYVKKSSEDKDAIEYVLTDHLRLSGMYWGLTALDLLGRLDRRPDVRIRRPGGTPRVRLAHRVEFQARILPTMQDRDARDPPRVASGLPRRDLPARRCPMQGCGI